MALALRASRLLSASVLIMNLSFFSSLGFVRRSRRRVSIGATLVGLKVFAHSYLLSFFSFFCVRFSSPPCGPAAEAVVLGLALPPPTFFSLSIVTFCSLSRNEPA